MIPEVFIWPPQHINAHIPVHLNTHEHPSQAHMNTIKEILGNRSVCQREEEVASQLWPYKWHFKVAVTPHSFP